MKFLLIVKEVRRQHVTLTKGKTKDNVPLGGRATIVREFALRSSAVGDVVDQVCGHVVVWAVKLAAAGFVIAREHHIRNLGGD